MKLPKLDNHKIFFLKLIIVVTLAYIIRALFQAPVEWLDLKMFMEQASNRVFSKADALKVLAFIGIVFYLFLKDRINMLNHNKIDWFQAISFTIGSILTVAAIYAVRYITNLNSLYAEPANTLIVIIKFLLLAASFISIVVAVFQIDYIRRFWKEFKKPSIISSISAVALYFILMWFQAQWFLFTNTIAILLSYALGLFYPVIYFIDGGIPILQILDFSIAIGAPCSGIDSMLLYTAFCIALYALDRSKLKPMPLLVVFIIGFIGTYAVNFLRLFLLILVGVNISPELAVGLFHTNAGWLLFIIYFLFFYAMAKKIVYKNPAKQEKTIKTEILQTIKKRL